MTTPGNHESFYNYTAFNHRYKMPHVKSKGNENYWFSYDYGNVHVVSISTEECFDAGCPQMLWLEQDLITAVENRERVPWLVLSLHRPMYCSDDGTGFLNSFQQALEPLVLKYDVDLVLQGHMHAYERIHPNVKGVVSAFPTHRRNDQGKLVDVYKSEGLGPVYVVQGNTGAMQIERWVQPKPEWSAVRFANGYIPPDNTPSVEGRSESELDGALLGFNYTDTFGFGVATFANATHLHYTCIPVTGTIGTDEFWVIKRQRI